MFHIRPEYSVRQWLLFCPVLLCACSGIADSPQPDGDGIPVSFSALSNWNADGTRLSEGSDGESTKFENGDAIGVFAYKNDSSTPDFMNNQRVTFDGTAWNYSPTKYWPQNDDDRLSFYAYYPWHESTDGSIVKAASSSANKLTIDYCCPNADIDLMASEKKENETLQANRGKVPFAFHHLLARVRFTFTYVGPGDYRPVVHMLKYKVPRCKASVTCYTDGQSGLSGKTYTSGNLTFTWSAAAQSDEAAEIVKYVNDVAGVVIANEKQPVDEFTAYLLPCEFPYSGNADSPKGNFTISLNNVLHTYTPDEQISINPGKSYTVNFKVTNDYGGTGNFFITSYSIWADGGTINGTLE